MQQGSDGGGGSMLCRTCGKYKERSLLPGGSVVEGQNGRAVRLQGQKQEVDPRSVDNSRNGAVHSRSLCVRYACRN